MGRIPEAVPEIHNSEKPMRLPRLNKKCGMALFGVVLVAFGGAGLLAAQVIRVGSNGAYLGIETEDVTATNMVQFKLSSETGVIVCSVEKGSPAEAARLLQNDVILEYAGMPVFSAAELARLVLETPVGRTLNLGVSRDGKKMNLTVKIGEQKDAGLASGFNLIAPSGVLRRFNVGPSGGGILQFAAPGGRNRTFSFAVPSRPQLGVTVETLTEQMAEYLGVPGRKGILVTTVTQGTPAASVLRAGDVIMSIDGKAVSTPAELTQEIGRKTQGAKIELKIVRDKKEVSVTADLSKPGTSPARTRI